LNQRRTHGSGGIAHSRVLGRLVRPPGTPPRLGAPAPGSSEGRRSGPGAPRDRSRRAPTCGSACRQARTTYTSAGRSSTGPPVPTGPSRPPADPAAAGSGARPSPGLQPLRYARDRLGLQNRRPAAPRGRRLPAATIDAGRNLPATLPAS